MFNFTFTLVVVIGLSYADSVARRFILVFLFANSKCKRYVRNKLKPSKLTGTRSRPLSFNPPKLLFPLAGQPMVHHPISACKLIPNLARIFLTGFHEEREFALYVSSISSELNIPVRYFKEDNPHGSVGGLYYFRDIIMEDNPSHIVLLNYAHRRYGGMGTLLVIKVSAESASEFSELVSDPDKGWLHQIREIIKWRGNYASMQWHRVFKGSRGIFGIYLLPGTIWSTSIKGHFRNLFIGVGKNNTMYISRVAKEDADRVDLLNKKLQYHWLHWYYIMLQQVHGNWHTVVRSLDRRKNYLLEVVNVVGRGKMVIIAAGYAKVSLKQLYGQNKQCTLVWSSIKTQLRDCAMLMKKNGWTHTLLVCIWLDFHLVIRNLFARVCFRIRMRFGTLLRVCLINACFLLFSLLVEV
ncbi:putative mannose-1-phosphate guanylyltransferase [Helianthus annuus]|nr:putative mannose-1-phosphate guanylyltransferase [Helianthus annuus]KAJ0496438.1 putative mannose-1-phosphate guanylyltransferase [Helianthus annuus]KAJ0662496.1 putative mannose-1-phosphate guanylyltransferase [Helianthus annuus]KAJ0670023.1 putative mannose-1-phosphate guanylyltransferase [Helianthus annuus]